MIYFVDHMGRDYLGEFEQVVLLAVARLRDDAYGAAIKSEIEERTGRGVTIGALYATLDRLEAKGFVRSWFGDPSPERGGRSKRNFELLPAGSEALSRSREMMAQMWKGVRLDRA
jgi:DNA-binding PadR family transcriptional regulator